MDGEGESNTAGCGIIKMVAHPRGLIHKKGRTSRMRAEPRRHENDRKGNQEDRDSPTGDPPACVRPSARHACSSAHSEGGKRSGGLCAYCTRSGRDAKQKDYLTVQDRRADHIVRRCSGCSGPVSLQDRRRRRPGTGKATCRSFQQAIDQSRSNSSSTIVPPRELRTGATAPHGWRRNCTEPPSEHTRKPRGLKKQDLACPLACSPR